MLNSHRFVKNPIYYLVRVIFIRSRSFAPQSAEHFALVIGCEKENSIINIVRLFARNLTMILCYDQNRHDRYIPTIDSAAPFLAVKHPKSAAPRPNSAADPTAKQAKRAAYGGGSAARDQPPGIFRP